MPVAAESRARQRVLVEVWDAEIVWLGLVAVAAAVERRGWSFKSESRRSDVRWYSVRRGNRGRGDSMSDIVIERDRGRRDSMSDIVIERAAVLRDLLLVQVEGKR